MCNSDVVFKATHYQTAILGSTYSFVNFLGSELIYQKLNTGWDGIEPS